MKRKMPLEVQAMLRCHRILAELPEDARARVIAYLQRAEYDAEPLPLGADKASSDR